MRATGPGPFVTRLAWRDEAGRLYATTSRRHRKRLAPRVVRDVEATVATAGGFGRLYAPHRIAWWVAVLFLIGSALFGIAAALACLSMGAAIALNRVFFLGSLFFTAAAGLQWLEAVNGDVREAGAIGARRPAWRWLTWQPRNLGYVAGLIQFAGTLLFNLDTGDALIAGLDRPEDLLLLWSPDMLGCACFLVASYLALVEVGHRFFSLEVRDLSWWIAIVNLAGSVAFEVSALYAFVPGGAAAWNSALWTAVGAGCFFLGAYLLLPEMFDEGR